RGTEPGQHDGDDRLDLPADVTTRDARTRGRDERADPRAHAVDPARVRDGRPDRVDVSKDLPHRHPFERPAANVRAARALGAIVVTSVCEGSPGRTPRTQRLH